jgi:hypothetical protein
MIYIAKQALSFIITESASSILNLLVTLYIKYKRIDLLEKA